MGGLCLGGHSARDAGCCGGSPCHGHGCNTLRPDSWPSHAGHRFGPSQSACSGLLLKAGFAQECLVFGRPFERLPRTAFRPRPPMLVANVIGTHCRIGSRLGRTGDQAENQCHPATPCLEHGPDHRTEASFTSNGLEPSVYGTHSVRRTKVAQVYQ
jgi:hypothetical protein